MEDHGTALTRVIANRVQNAIAHLPDGEVLSSGEAFVLIQDTVRKDAIESGGDLSDVQLDIYIRTTCQAAFLESRRLVAEQLRGMTLQDAVMAITDGVRRLMAEDSLEIVPKPTKTFSGYCDVYDP